MGDILEFKKKRLNTGTRKTLNNDVPTPNNISHINPKNSISIKIDQKEVPIFDPYDYMDEPSFFTLVKSFFSVIFEMVSNTLTNLINSIPYFLEIVIASAIFAFVCGVFKFVSIIMNT